MVRSGARVTRTAARERRTGVRLAVRRTGVTGRGAQAAAGAIGPVAFTAAWIAASLRQPGYSPAEIQISGLAAPGARDPWIMEAGFLVLGGCLIAFGPALRRRLGGPRSRKRPARTAAAAGSAPWLVQAAGVLVIAAGLLRRDQMLLTAGPGSWHNQAHNAVSGAIYVLLVAIPLVLALRLRREPAPELPAALFAAAAIATAVVLAVFAAAGANSPLAGALQRAGVSIPLAALVAVAARLGPAERSAGPGRQ